MPSIGREDSSQALLNAGYGAWPWRLEKIPDGPGESLFLGRQGAEGWDDGRSDLE